MTVEFTRSGSSSFLMGHQGAPVAEIILWSDAGFSLTPSLFMSHYALVHWLEALGWIGKASEVIQIILSLEAHVPVSYLSIILTRKPVGLSQPRKPFLIIVNSSRKL
jgi:hypothetical protein